MTRINHISSHFYVHISIWTFCTMFIYFVLDGLCNQFVFEHFVPNIQLLLKTYTFTKFCETLTVINYAGRVLLIKTLHKFRTIKLWFTLYLHKHILGKYKFRCFVYPASLSCVLYSIDICTVASRKIRNMHDVLTNQCNYNFMNKIGKRSNTETVQFPLDNFSLDNYTPPALNSSPRDNCPQDNYHQENCPMTITLPDN